MNGIKKIMSFMNFQDSYSLSTRNKVILGEWNWLKSKIIVPTDALFIPYAYAGVNYPAFFTEVEQAFLKVSITLKDIKRGDAETLINTANMIVVCGGNYSTFKKEMDALKAGGFDAYPALKARIDNSVPCIGWNEGGGVLAPFLFVPPAQPIGTGINTSPLQLVCNFIYNQPNKDAIKALLIANPTIPEVICQVNAAGGEGTAVRLEESGSGILSSGTAPYPVIIHFRVVGGQLIES